MFLYFCRSCCLCHCELSCVFVSVATWHGGNNISHVTSCENVFIFCFETVPLFVTRHFCSQCTEPFHTIEHQQFHCSCCCSYIQNKNRSRHISWLSEVFTRAETFAQVSLDSSNVWFPWQVLWCFLDIFTSSNNISVFSEQQQVFTRCGSGLYQPRNTTMIGISAEKKGSWSFGWLERLFIRLLVEAGLCWNGLGTNNWSDKYANCPVKLATQKKIFCCNDFDRQQTTFALDNWQVHCHKLVTNCFAWSSHLCLCAVQQPSHFPDWQIGKYLQGTHQPWIIFIYSIDYNSNSLQYLSDCHLLWTSFIVSFSFLFIFHHNHWHSRSLYCRSHDQFSSLWNSSKQGDCWFVSKTKTFRFKRTETSWSNPNKFFLWPSEAKKAWNGELGLLSTHNEEPPEQGLMLKFQMQAVWVRFWEKYWVYMQVSTYNTEHFEFPVLKVQIAGSCQMGDSALYFRSWQ